MRAGCARCSGSSARPDHGAAHHGQSDGHHAQLAQHDSARRACHADRPQPPDQPEQSDDQWPELKSDGYWAQRRERDAERSRAAGCHEHERALSGEMI